MKLDGNLLALKHREAYRVTLILNGKYFLHQNCFHSLSEAVNLLKKVEVKREINLEYWVPAIVREKQFLIRNRGKKQKAHIWLGKDTACKMWSTGGLKVSGFDLHEDTQDKDICTMCRNAVTS